MPRSRLILEFFALYFVLPLAYRYSPVRIPALPALWLAAGYALWQLLRDPGFDRDKLWNLAPLRGQLPAILATFCCAAFLLWLGVHRFTTGLEWDFVRRHPSFWAMVMVAYPVLSVYPQGLIYRAFFFSRYTALFPGRWTMTLASAAVFSFMHIVFRNPIAPALTFVGGLFFAYRYRQTGSLATSSFEHSLYGCWLFTIGLGLYFYHGTIASAAEFVRR
jgi:membrane protease YdiL (CAAX protease family)